MEFFIESEATYKFKLFDIKDEPIYTLNDVAQIGSHNKRKKTYNSNPDIKRELSNIINYYVIHSIFLTKNHFHWYFYNRQTGWSPPLEFFFYLILLNFY